LDFGDIDWWKRGQTCEKTSIFLTYVELKDSGIQFSVTGSSFSMTEFRLSWEHGDPKVSACDPKVGCDPAVEKTAL